MQKKNPILFFVDRNKYLELPEIAKNYYIYGLIDMWMRSGPTMYRWIVYSCMAKDIEKMRGVQIRAIFEKHLRENPE